jgi:hypothetical protein
VNSRDCELARMFPEGRLYYQDGGILGGNYWQIDDVGRYGRTGNNAWWPCAGDYAESFDGPEGARRITGRVYIENMAGNSGELRVAAFEGELRHLDDPAGMTLLETYAAELYPECIVRCAAFLRAFEEERAKQLRGMGCAGRPAGDGGKGAPWHEAAGDTAVLAAACLVLLARGRRKTIRAIRFLTALGMTQGRNNTG